jgi:hypothetical protein
MVPCSNIAPCCDLINLLTNPSAVSEWTESSSIPDTILPSKSTYAYDSNGQSSYLILSSDL